MSGWLRVAWPALCGVSSIGEQGSPALSCTHTSIILTVCLFLLLWMVRHAHGYVSSGRNEKKQVPFPQSTSLVLQDFFGFSKLTEADLSKPSKSSS